MLSQWEIDHRNRRRRRERIAVWSVVIWLVGVGVAVYAGMHAHFLLMTSCVPMVAIAGIGIFFYLPFDSTFRYKRWAFPILSIALVVLFGWLCLDVPYAIRHDYSVAEGIPNYKEIQRDKHGDPVGVRVYFRGHDFLLEDKTMADVENRWIVIRYLPHTEMIMEEKIFSEEETRKMLAK